MKQVLIYTDGACSGNPGKGGWCAILKYKKSEKILSGGEQLTTNNKMELFAVISALEALKEPCNVKLYSDSAYVVNAVSDKWLEGWMANGWKTSDNKPVKNIELWQRLLPLLKRHKIVFFKVKGHADNENNNRCDKIAVEEIKKISG